MKKEITITIDLNEELDKMLEDIRWQHIDVDQAIIWGKHYP